MTPSPVVLVLNSGSSSLKYQLIEPDSGDSLADGIVEQIGEPSSAVIDYARRCGSRSRSCPTTASI